MAKTLGTVRGKLPVLGDVVVPFQFFQAPRCQFRPPMEELRHVRLLKPKQMLAETDEKVITIALLTGDQTSHNVCHVFKQQVGNARSEIYDSEETRIAASNPLKDEFGHQAFLAISCCSTKTPYLKNFGLHNECMRCGITFVS